MIAALQKRVREQAAEIEQLKKQVEVAYGLLAVQRKVKRAKSASIMEIDDSLPGNAAHHLVSFA